MKKTLLKTLVIIVINFGGHQSYSQCNPCFTIASGDADNITTVWSDVSGGNPGFSCANDGTVDIIVEGGFTLNINTDYQFNDVTVGTADVGTILSTGGQLGIENAGTVTINSGSKIDLANGGNDQSITFHSDNDGAQTYALVVNDNTNGLECENLQIDGDEVTLNISGTGVVNINSNFSITEGDAAITNDMVGTITIDDELQIADGNDDDITFTNNQTMIIADRLLFNAAADDCAFIGGTSSSTTIQNSIEFAASTDKNATITNDGTIAVTSDIEFFQGNTTVNNTANGIITVGGQITHDNDDADLDVINAGSITIAGDIEMVANDNSADWVNSGTLSFDRVDASDGDLDITNTGTINQSGTFWKVTALSQFINGIDGRWNYGGTAEDSDTDMDCSAAGNTFCYNLGGNPGNQTMISVKDGKYHNLEFKGAGKKASSVHMDIEGNILIADDADFDVNSGNHNIAIAGDWTNTSTEGFTEGNETVSFDGVGAQSITCSGIGTETFHDLQINKSSGGEVTFHNDVAIKANGTLDFTGGHGYIRLNENDISIENWTAGDITGYDEDEFIIVDNVGKIDVEGIENGEILNLPMGLAPDSANYNLANVTMNDAGDGTFTANLCGQVQEDGGCGAPDPIDEYGVERTWNFGSTSDDAQVELFWHSESEMDEFDDTESFIAKHEGGLWDGIEPGIPVTNEGGHMRSMSMHMSTGTVGKFTLGAKGGLLPIELISFSAAQNGNVIDLRWATGSEINNDYFTVQRSADGINFEDIAVVGGAGNSFSPLNYFSTDEDPEIGEDYYRLMQTDFDGTKTYSSVVSAYINDGSEQTNSDGESLNVTVFPNPVIGSKFYLSAKNSSEQKEILVIVHDLYGKEAFSKIIVLEESSSSVIAVDAQEGLKPGIYMITGSSNHQLFSKKLVVK